MSLKSKNYVALYCALGLALVWVALEILAPLGAASSPLLFLRHFWEAWGAGAARVSVTFGYAVCALWFVARNLKRRRARRGAAVISPRAPEDFRRAARARWRILPCVKTERQRPTVKRGLARARDLQGEPYL